MSIHVLCDAIDHGLIHIVGFNGRPVAVPIDHLEKQKKDQLS